jgi:general secretion pathway protein G
MVSKQIATTFDHRRPKGFTLVEILIVVVIMAILAGTVISLLENTADDAKSSSLKHSMSVVQSQLELYRMDHLSQYPTIQNNALPQLINATNAKGDIGTAGSAYPYGPYLIEAPRNPYDGNTRVTAVSKPGAVPTGVVDSSGGWQYDATTGGFWPNNAEYYK